MSDIDTNKIVVSNKVISGKQDFKYPIGYKDEIKPLCIFRPRMSMCKRDFLTKDEKNFDKYNEIWEKVSKIIIKKRK